MSDPLAEALRLALQGRGRVEPNPMVGAVIVKDGTVIGRGAHRIFGGHHAEVEALEQAGEGARGASLYITLEPCSTLGKTPPCTEAILASGIEHVVWAVDDPNPVHSGRAAALLEAAGVRVTPAVAEDLGNALLHRFTTVQRRNSPFVIVKWAQTLAGRTSTPRDTPPEISGLQSRTQVHADRAACCAILVGVGTAIDDDPSLTVRLADGKSPQRLVLDSQLRTPLASNVLTTPPVTTFFCGPDVDLVRKAECEAAGARVKKLSRDGGSLDLAEMLHFLQDDGMHRVFVEGGAAVRESFFRENLVDFVQVYIADAAESEAAAGVVEALITEHSLIDTQTESIGADILLSGYCD